MEELLQPQLKYQIIDIDELGGRPLENSLAGSTRSIIILRQSRMPIYVPSSALHLSAGDGEPYWMRTTPDVIVSIDGTRVPKEARYGRLQPNQRLLASTLRGRRFVEAKVCRGE